MYSNKKKISDIHKYNLTYMFLLINIIVISFTVSTNAADTQTDELYNCSFVYDFQMPVYDGVNDLQFIDNQWLLIVNDYWQDAKKQARQLASESAEGKELLKYKGKWNRWSWVQKWNKVGKQYFRDSYTQYKNMGDPDFFSISSSDDKNYLTPRKPEKAIRWHQQIGAYFSYNYAEDCDMANPLLGCYGYLKLPFPMKTGSTYTITQKDNRKVTFIWDESSCVSRAIKVNQNGYTSASEKNTAYLGLWIPTIGPFNFSKWDGKEFNIISVESGKSVFKGIIKLKAENPKFLRKNKETKEEESTSPICGENLYTMDLNGMQSTGDFFIRIDGIGRSWPFYYGKDAYGRAFYISMRGMYHQRCGIALTDEYTAWTRGACHTNAGEAAMIPLTSYMRKDKLNLPVNDFTAIKRTGNINPPVKYSGRGGWHDAADFDRRWFHYQAVWDLLFAYELSPIYFTDGQLNIPESGNGIPDILDEAAYGLLCWRNTQNEAGGVAGRIEQIAHPQYQKFGMPDKDPLPMYNSLRTREFSLRYAAAASQLARLLKPFNKKEAGEWLQSAEKAYNFGMDTNNAIDISNYAESNQPVKEKEHWNYRSLCMAGIQMYLSTGKKTYLEDGIKHFDYTLSTMEHPFRCMMQLLPYALSEDPAIPEEVHKKARDFYLKKAEVHYSYLARQPYPFSLPLDWPWGFAWGTGTMTNYGRWLMIGYFLSGKTEQKYLDGAAMNADYMLGCNPLGISWMSGCGYNYPTVFFDAESQMDGIKDPVPGITVYGPTGGIGMGARKHGYFYLAEFNKFQPEKGDLAFCPPPFDSLGGLGNIPTMRRWTPDYHSDPALQEFTIWETMSPSCFTYGLLMGEGWKPDSKLKQMKPRPDRFLFGNYLTP